MKPESVNRKAKDLLDNGKIAARLEELNAGAVSDAVMTRREALERLSSFARTDLADLVEFGSYEIGEQDGQPIIQAAWKIKAKADALVTKAEVTKEVTSEQLVTERS